jgi:hypothetical protein
MKEVTRAHVIAVAAKGYERTEKGIQDALVRRNYNKLKKRVPSALQHKEPSQQRKAPRSKRESFPPLEGAKFHLRALCTQDNQEHPLYEALTELLRILYKRTLLSKKEGVAHLMAQALLLSAKQNPLATDLTALYPQDTALQELYYKMLRGTEYYDLEKEEGIPPLSHFLSLQPSAKVAFLSFASHPVLSALFGEKGAAAICGLEDKRGGSIPCSKADLSSLFSSPSEVRQLALVEPYLNYSKQYGARQSIARRHAPTGIQIEKLL